MAAPVTLAADLDDPSPTSTPKSYADSVNAPATPDALPSVNPPPADKVGLPKRLADSEHEKTQLLSPPETPSKQPEPSQVESRSRNPLDEAVFDDDEDEDVKLPGVEDEGEETEEEQAVKKVAPLEIKEDPVEQEKGEVSPIIKDGAIASGDESGEVSDVGESVVSNEPVKEEKVEEEKHSLMEDFHIDSKTVTENIPSLVSHVPHSLTWAPLHVPFERRMQTAMVIWFTLAITFCFALFWFLLAVPLTWPLLIPYILYVLFSSSHETGAPPFMRSNLFRRLPMWKYYTGYFPIRLHRTAPLDPTKNYIFAYHPHGIISHGAFGNFATEATGFSTLFPGITNTLLTLDSNFRIPFYRDYLLSLGLASVSRRSCEALLRGTGRPTFHRILSRFLPSFLAARFTPPTPPAGRAITIVIGGARESLEAFPGTMRLVCRRRRGFLKLAMREGTGVVPVLAFGENDLYDQMKPGDGTLVGKAQGWVKKTMGFALPVFHARGIFNYDVGLLPYRREVNTVVGKPLFWEGDREEVTEEELSAFQERYMTEIVAMWERYKGTFAKERTGEMEFIE